MRYFSEVQRFDQWWLHVINVIVVGSMAYPLYLAYYAEHLNATKTGILVVSIIIAVCAILFIYTIRLVTHIDERGLTFKFYPFHQKPKTVLWTDMAACEVRIYHPIRDYGGWGYRGIGRKDKAYNIKGNQGIKIVLENGESVLIGTQKAKEAQQIINKYFKHNERV